MNRFLRIFLLFFAVSLAASAQEVIRVTGVGKSKDSKKPLYQVAIYDFFTKKKYETDVDGRFAFDTSPKATLCFTYIFDPVTIKVKGRNYRTAEGSSVLAFRKVLENRGVAVTVRRTLGSDIDAACGQLRASTER